MHRIATGLAIFGLFWGWGCSPNPRQVCKKFQQLEVKDAVGPKRSDHARNQDHQTCVKQMTRLKGNHPKAYKCVAQCSEQDHIDAAMLCSFGCMLKHTPDTKRLARSEPQPKAQPKPQSKP